MKFIQENNVEMDQYVFENEHLRKFDIELKVNHHRKQFRFRGVHLPLFSYRYLIHDDEEVKLKKSQKKA